MNKKSLNNSKGFTLLELLIVVAIIGLLASMILVGLSSFRTRGRDARRIADLRQVQNGLEIYYTKNLQYPIYSSSGNSLDSWNALTAALAGVGIRQTPQDPLGDSSSYTYASNLNGQSYVLMAILEDTDNNILAKDIDVNTHGVECADPNYCIEF